MRTAALSLQPDPRLTPTAIGRAATLALYDELSLTPKPGLVTLIDCGSHEDMDAHTFMRSLFALRRYFAQIAEAGFGGADFALLERYGIAAEARMLAATGGINTHRGAIFMLGLLCAAAGAALREHGGALHPLQLRDALRRDWGDALATRSRRPPTLPGGIAARRHGLRSASEEAALAFPVLFETALPALRAALARGLTSQQARLDTLFHAAFWIEGALRGRTAFRRREPLQKPLSRGDCRPVARQTRSPRPAGSLACVQANELCSGFFRPGNPASCDAALVGGR